MAGLADENLLSIGVFLVMIVVSILLASLNVITWGLVPPLMIALYGCWLLVLAGMQSSSPQKYGRGAFSLLGWGVLFIAVGGALFLAGFNLVYSFVVVLLALAALAIFAALRRK
jgi:hypothetical protein